MKNIRAEVENNIWNKIYNRGIKSTPPSTYNMWTQIGQNIGISIKLRAKESLINNFKELVRQNYQPIKNNIKKNIKVNEKINK